MTDKKKLAGIFLNVIFVNVFGILIVNKTSDDVVVFTGPRNFSEEVQVWYEEELQKSAEVLRLY